MSVVHHLLWAVLFLVPKDSTQNSTVTWRVCVCVRVWRILRLQNLSCGNTVFSYTDGNYDEGLWLLANRMLYVISDRPKLSCSVWQACLYSIWLVRTRWRLPHPVFAENMLKDWSAEALSQFIYWAGKHCESLSSVCFVQVLYGRFLKDHSYKVFFLIRMPYLESEC